MTELCVDSIRLCFVQDNNQYAQVRASMVELLKTLAARPDWTTVSVEDAENIANTVSGRRVSIGSGPYSIQFDLRYHSDLCHSSVRRGIKSDGGCGHSKSVCCFGIVFKNYFPLNNMLTNYYKKTKFE